MNDARYLLFKNLSIKNQKLKKKQKKPGKTTQNYVVNQSRLN